MDDEVVEFDMIGIDPPLANALRRILIAEVSTVAISRVTIFQNTGVIHDENLAHRLGLVPIVFEPEYLEWKAQDSDFTTDNSLMFRRRVTERDLRTTLSTRTVVVCRHLSRARATLHGVQTGTKPTLSLLCTSLSHKDYVSARTCCPRFGLCLATP